MAINNGLDSVVEKIHALADKILEGSKTLTRQITGYYYTNLDKPDTSKPDTLEACVLGVACYGITGNKVNHDEIPVLLNNYPLYTYLTIPGEEWAGRCSLKTWLIHLNDEKRYTPEQIAQKLKAVAIENIEGENRRRNNGNGMVSW